MPSVSTLACALRRCFRPSWTDARVLGSLHLGARSPRPSGLPSTTIHGAPRAFLRVRRVIRLGFSVYLSWGTSSIVLEGHCPPCIHVRPHKARTLRTRFTGSLLPVSLPSGALLSPSRLHCPGSSRWYASPGAHGLSPLRVPASARARSRSQALRFSYVRAPWSPRGRSVLMLGCMACPSSGATSGLCSGHTVFPFSRAPQS